MKIEKHVDTGKTAAPKKGEMHASHFFGRCRFPFSLNLFGMKCRSIIEKDNLLILNMNN